MVIIYDYLQLYGYNKNSQSNPKVFDVQTNMTTKNKVQPLDDPNDREKDNPSVFVISDQTMTSYPEELRIANFRSQEILPHLDNYLISNEGKTYEK